MTLAATIESKLTEALAPERMNLVNESHMHSVPDGSESHFKVVIVSDDFDGKMLIARHRMVNKVLEEELRKDREQGGIHAEGQLTGFAPVEYAGHEIASHTVNHPHLTRLDDEAIRREVNRDVEVLERQGGAPVVSLASGPSTATLTVDSSAVARMVPPATSARARTAISALPPNPTRMAYLPFRPAPGGDGPSVPLAA